MQRSIQPNDIVIISSSGLQPSSYVIKEIKADEIVLTDSLEPNNSISLIPSLTDPNKWVIFGFDDSIFIH